MIHSLADDKIPFCPYFIIPYVLWYFFLIGTVIYFAVFCPSKKEYYQYLGTLGVGMTLFLLISYVYPNGQHLRPDLGSTGGGAFISVIRFLYKIDTPTNIFPSMHVFNATASCIALYQNERCRKNKLFTVSQIILTISIVLSTMFLKQHSVADVMTALILNILCYQLFTECFLQERNAWQKYLHAERSVRFRICSAHFDCVWQLYSLEYLRDMV